MTDVYVDLGKYELAHFRDLYNGAGQFRFSERDATPEQKRQRAIDALASVLPNERVREEIGADEDPFVRLRTPGASRFSRPGAASK